MGENFNKVFDLFLDTSILSLRKYETNGINIYEFHIDDLENILTKKIIDNIPSIYILENIKKNEYYIGETENFLNRINDHKKNKEFDNIYVIDSAILNKNICLELESKTIEIFKNSIGNYKVLNKNEINNSYLSYRDELRFKDFWKIFKEIYFLLKFNLNPKKDLSFEKDENEVIFYYNEAKMKQVEGGYLALEGSKINMEEPKDYKSSKNFNKKIKKIRKTLIEEKIINSEGKFLQNYFFRYPSWFSDLVSATSTSGYEKFKTKEQITLNAYLDRKINKNNI